VGWWIEENPGVRYESQFADTFGEGIWVEYWYIKD
jgi:hypothetical protein